jgi:uncharacterized ferritin-like protein (DUF455 family)
MITLINETKLTLDQYYRFNVIGFLFAFDWKDVMSGVIDMGNWDGLQ